MPKRLDHSKRKLKSQAELRIRQELARFKLFANELDEHFLELGPRLLDDSYYDESKPLRGTRDKS